jgi:DNA-binding protein HU-beta
MPITANAGILSINIEAKEYTMNKNEFIAAISENATLEALSLPKSTIASVVEAALETIAEALKKGDEVRLVGFGNFYVSKREASKGRNPRTGEEIDIKAAQNPKFKAGKLLKDHVNNVPAKK